MRRPLSADENAERLEDCRRMAAEGASTGDVARFLEISAAAVSQWLLRMDEPELRLELQKNAHRGTHIDGQVRAENIVKWLQMGKKRTEIADLLGISPPAVTQWIQNNHQQYPILSEFVRQGGFKLKKKVRTRNGAVTRQQAARLRNLLKVRAFMQQGYPITVASTEAGLAHSYTGMAIERAGYKVDYHGLNMLIGDIWERLHPGEEDPIEYPKEPKIPAALRESAVARAQHLWHRDRWMQQEGLT